MDVQAQETIDRPRDEVFAAFCDLGRGAERMSAIEQLELLTDGPFGVGTRWRETRTMFGRQATEEMEVTAVDAPSSYRVEAASHGAHYVSTLTFDELGPSSTSVTMSFNGRPTTFLGKVFVPLMAPLVRGTARRGLEQDLADMKHALEGAAS